MCRIVIPKRLGIYFPPWIGIGEPIPKNVKRDMHMLARTVITLLRHLDPALLFNRPVVHALRAKLQIGALPKLALERLAIMQSGAQRVSRNLRCAVDNCVFHH